MSKTTWISMFKLTTLAVRVTLCNIHVSTFTHCLRVHDWRPRQSLHVYVWIFIHVGAFKSQCPWQMSTSKPACLSLNIYPCRSFHISMSMTDDPYSSLHAYDWIFIHVRAFTSQCPWLTIHVQTFTPAYPWTNVYANAFTRTRQGLNPCWHLHSYL